VQENLIFSLKKVSEATAKKMENNKDSHAVILLVSVQTPNAPTQIFVRECEHISSQSFNLEIRNSFTWLGLEPASDPRELVEDHEDHREQLQEGYVEGVEIQHRRIAQRDALDWGRVGCFADLASGKLKDCQDGHDHLGASVFVADH
jgi:hypothetical protein